MDTSDLQKIHRTVLLKEAVDGLSPKDGGVYVDATCGFGGHSREIAKQIPNGKLILIDRDVFALESAKKNLEDLQTKVFTYNGGYEDLEKVLESFNVTQIDGIVFDLGVSSYQIDTSGRGFSFKQDEPLRMTMKQDPESDDVTAYDVVNTWSKETLETILTGFGEERFSKRIVAGIVSARDIKPIETTFELVGIIESSIPAWHKKFKIHPATKTFQAIRMAVNEELQSLEKGLNLGSKYLKNSGRIVVISFHSLEDRIVKRYFNNLEDEGYGARITKKPIVPTDEEVKENPRSRSAKLRVFQKNDKQK